MNLPVEVLGSEKLVASFGSWPSFHDSEILSVHLDRADNESDAGPMLTIQFHLVQGCANTGHVDGVRGESNTLVTLAFVNITDLQLFAFNHQNAIFDLVLSDDGVHPDTPNLRAIRVGLQASYGASGSWLCSSIRVLEVISGRPPGGVTEQ